jgi:beta-lactamase regulating signal transducer with metallopeptidase domain
MILLTEAFSIVVAQSWRIGCLILAWAALRLLLRGRIPQQILFVGWMIVALSLLIPVSMPVAWSPFNFARPARWVSTVGLSPVQSSAQPRSIATTAEPIVPTDTATSPVHRLTDAWPLRNLLTIIWLTGIGGLVGVRLLAWARFYRRLRRLPAEASLRISMAVAECAEILRIKSPISVRATDAAEGPALGGLWKPVVLIPTRLGEALTTDELRLVLLHELGHWRRGDLRANLLIQGAQVLHWFNPLVWFAARMARMDCELACDEFVMRRISPDGTCAYGATLLKVLGIVRGQSPTPAVLGILENKQLLKRRIQLIADYRTWPTGRVLAGLVFLALLAIAAVTGEAQARAADSSTAVITTIAPKGWWKNGSQPNAYVVGVDPTQPKIKPASAYVKSIEPRIDGFGGLMQMCSAETYRGKRLRFSAMMKTAAAESAHLWFRVDAPGNRPIEFDNMDNRPLNGNTDWTLCTIVLDVPTEAADLAYGFFISGTGQAWVNNAKLEEVGTDVPTTGGSLSTNVYPKAPVNMDFIPRELSATPFVLGRRKFEAGDAISIEQVLATSPKFEIGDHVVVRGRYHLASEAKATLALFMTTTDGNGKENISPSQRTEVKKGSGAFELSYDVQHTGALHVTFYGIPDGKSFGGQYFGTEPQMTEIQDRPIFDYAK